MELRYTFDQERFYLGTLCVHGHAWPGTKQSLRRIAQRDNCVKNDRRRPVGIRAGDCIGCCGRKQSDWLLSFLDYEAMGWPESQTLGKLCKKGHKWGGLDASLRSHGHCVECEKLKNLGKRKKPLGPSVPRLLQKKIRRHQQYTMLREQGLTTRGTPAMRPDACVPRQALALEAALRKAIRGAGRCPSVARLVMEAQRQYWREHPEAKREHDKQWAQASWWLQYQINPDLRLYVRQKSKRRKALLRQQTAHQIKPRVIRARFAQFDNCCTYCGAAGDMQIEHVVPISRGGTHAIGNIVPACQSCNYSKREHEVERWYRAQPQFSEKRWRKICQVLGWDRASVGQLALL